MGNMLPCLVQQGTRALPAMNPKRRLISLKLLMKAIRKLKKRTACGNDGKAAAKIDSKSSSAAAAAAGPVEDGKGGEVLEATRSSKASSNNPKGAVLRSRLLQHGGRSGKKGVVRVKVVLTKEEAARLLSLTVGGQKNAAQVVAEMKKMEAARRAVNAAAAWRPALASIPEESS